MLVLLYNIDMKIEGPGLRIKKDDPRILDQILAVTTIKEVGEGEVSVADQLRLESFNNFSDNMKEALSHIGGIFKDTKYPWAIHGSTALVLEAETSKEPIDIDIAFADLDKEVVLNNFKKLQVDGLIRKLAPEDMQDFEGKNNGCTRISAEIRTGETEPYVWIEVEAFAQNVDPNKPANGITNPGLDPMTITQYKGEGDVKLFFADREENFKFYLQIAAIELQKYNLDISFESEDANEYEKIKNKFPQRLNNILAIIKRREREEFEELLKDGQVKEEDRPNIEDVTEENIIELVREFVSHNNDTRLFEKFNKASTRLDPIDVLFQKWGQFNSSKTEGLGVHEGFVKQRRREDALDELTQEGLIDMTVIADSHQGLKVLKKQLDTLVASCEQGCDEPTKVEIIKVKEEILIKNENIIKEIENTKEKYEKYLGQINYKDNRDFIAYVAIKETLESYIIPSLKLAENLKGRIKEVSFS